jgi:antitoxin component YwqK of YwqJK toxin-antitoxin module
MRPYLLFFILFISNFCFNQTRYEADKTTIDLEDSIVYLRSNMRPITGIIFKKYPNGKLKFEHEFKDGKKNGIAKDWYENGQLLGEMLFKNGNEEGLFKLFDENGDVFNEINYKNGRQDGLQRLWHNGNLIHEINFKDGKQNGLERSWYDNGQLTWETNYKNGLIDGISRTYYQSGKLYKQNNFINGKYDGLQIIYSEEGNILGKVNLIDGSGKLIMKYSSGKMLTEITYTKGEETMIKGWYENGQLKREILSKEHEVVQSKCYDELGNSIKCPIGWNF